MPDRSEEAKYSTLRVTRPALMTEQLIKFLRKMEAVVLDTFGVDDSTLIYESETLEQQLAPGHRRSRKGVSISNAQVYAPNGVKLSLFERRAPVSSGLSRSFSRAKDRAIAQTHPAPKEPGNPRPGRVENPFYTDLFDAAIKYEIDDPNVLEVTGVGIIQSLNQDYDHRGNEYGFVLDPGAMQTLYLNDEANIVYRAIKGIKNGDRNTNRVMYPTTRTALHVPFMRLPYDVDPRATSKFLEIIKDDYLPTDLMLGPQDWGGNETVTL